MGNNFKYLFQNEINVEVDFGPVMRFSLMRSKKWIKRFVFVEGVTDKTFYINTNISYLSDNAYYFFRTCSDGFELDEFKGKESVFYSLFQITNNPMLSSCLEKCTFIVDRDFSHHQCSKLCLLSKADYSKVNVTKGHSMESYFFEKSNLKLIFSKFGLELKCFMDLIEDFNGQMSRFYALKTVITENYSKGIKIPYKKKYTDDELFVFDFSLSDYWVSREKVLEECSTMEAVIAKGVDWERSVNELEAEIASNIMLIRGHDSFRLLAEYLKQKANIIIAFPKGKCRELHELIGDFTVSFDCINI